MILDNEPLGVGRILAATMLAALLPTAAVAQRCEGPTFEHHTTAPYEFDTNSHVERGDYSYISCLTGKPKPMKGEYWRIDRCAYNPDAKYKLHIIWFVPQWETWIPPNCVLEQPRYSIQEPKPQLLRSCIEYANAGRMTTAQYLGDDEEQKAAAAEDQANCRPSPPLKPAKEAAAVDTPRPLAFATELVFPSDAERPDQTMLGLTGTYAIAAEKSSYASSFSYQLAALPGSEGDPTAIEMRPILRGAAEGLTRYLGPDLRSGRVKMQKESSLQLLDVKGEGPWHLVQAVLQFFDRSGKSVGRFEVPLFVSDK